MNVEGVGCLEFSGWIDLIEDRKNEALGKYLDSPTELGWFYRSGSERWFMAPLSQSDVLGWYDRRFLYDFE